MPAFLEKLTEHIYANHADSLGNISIVLPNRRAILYIKHYLSKSISNTTFLPEFYSIEDFVYKCSGLLGSDQLGDQFSLYSIHMELEGSDARSIENFFPFAAWMLSDFNEIDMYLGDKEKLYRHLTDTRAMSLWNPDGRPLSELENQYLGFYRSLETYYDRLNELLRKKGIAYQGGAFRQMAENIEEIAQKWPWEKTFFAGFNALTPSEEKIITHLIKEEKAGVYWDADHYYLDDRAQEAGYFLRDYIKNIKSDTRDWIEDNFKQPKDISITGAPGNTAQIKHAGELLKSILEEQGHLDRTALVLADESLLLPMLNSIPGEAGKFNVTMGLALKHTPLYSLLDSFVSMHRNADRFLETGSLKQRAYYIKDLLRLTDHPWFELLIPQEQNSISEGIKSYKQVFISPKKLASLFKGSEHVLSSLFPAATGPEDLVESVNALLDMLRKAFIELKEAEEQSYQLEFEYIFRFKGLTQRLKDLMISHKTITTNRTLHQIFRQLAQQERIAFRGEPLAGLQVMGMLETRTLDFDTVIMLSVNEGTLPASRMPNSFIPYEIKNEAAFKLPTFRHNNRVFAYHFYRLLQRSQKAYLLYNTESDVLGGGEKSRFIAQLEFECRKYSKSIQIKEELLTIPPVSTLRDTGISIEKDGSVQALLRKEAAHGFHPSSLSKYINCPLQFYLSRIAKVEDLEEIEETIDAKTLGTVAHESLRTLMEPLLGIPLTKEILSDLKKDVDKEVDRQFAKEFNSEEISYGKNYLIVGVARHMIKQILDREAEWLEEGSETILSELEEPLSIQVELQNIGPVKFRGTADRIDRKGGQTRILDYKTGGVEESKLKWTDWEKLFNDPDYSQGFQLMMYSWLYANKNSDIMPSAGIISLKMPGNGPMMIKPGGKDGIEKTDFELFESGLLGLIDEIFDPATPFGQTEDEKRCRYCSFKEICKRSLGKTEF